MCVCVYVCVSMCLCVYVCVDDYVCVSMTMGLSTIDLTHPGPQAIVTDSAKEVRKAWSKGSNVPSHVKMAGIITFEGEDRQIVVAANTYTHTHTQTSWSGY